MSTEAATPREQGRDTGHPQLTGVAVLIVLHLLFIASLQVFPEWTGLKKDASPMLIGLVQLYYVIPATLLALKLRRPAVAMGILKGALVTFVLNLVSCGFILVQLSKIGG